ncbi:MAG: DUF4392 domain-containing protein [Limnochordaceae bacterium]|nr:DUF4392 domain-containing protein [Limnochordaceae bacterium]
MPEASRQANAVELPELPASMFRVMDHLIAADLTARGVVDPLFEAAAAQACGTVEGRSGPPSLTEAVSGAIARRLIAHGAGARALLATGFPSRSWLFDDLTETDGPVGVAVLARSSRRRGKSYRW